jgi:hypothetical protein
VKQYFWNCADETGHIIKARNHNSAYNKAIKKRMEWTGEDKETCKRWFEKNDSIQEINGEVIQ